MAETMEAGRELDALVAERVFGWVWKLDEDRYGNGRTSGLYRIICDPALWGDEYPLLGLAKGDEPAHIDRPYNGQNPPRYSTDITAAWLVVEKLLADAHDIVIRPNGVASDRLARVEIGVCVDGSFGSDDEYCADALTTPHAICLAALAAVDALRSSPSGELENG